MVAGAGVLLGLRVWLITFARLPRVMGDEIGSWAVARFLLTGRVEISMLTQPSYPVGPGALLTTVAWLPGPVTRYMAFQVLAGVSLAVAACLGGSVIGRLFGLEWRQRITLGVLMCGLPAVFFTSAFSWSEFVIPAYWAVLAWAVTSRERPGIGVAVVAGAAVGMAPLIHGRFLAVPAVWILYQLIVGAASRGGRRRAARWEAAVSVVATAVTVAVAIVVNGFVVDHVWKEVGGADTMAWSRHLTDLSLYKAIAVIGGGQVWYALASTGGIAALALVVLFHRVRSCPPVRRPIAVLLIMMLSTIAASVLMLAGWATSINFGYVRVDHFVYGRYIDGVVWLLFAIGCAGLLQQGCERSLARAIGVVVVVMILAGILVSIAIDQIGQRVALILFFGPTAVGVWLLPGGGDSYNIIAWTLVGAAVALAVLATQLLRRTVVTAFVLVALTVLGAYVATLRVQSTHEKWGYADAIDIPDPSGPGRRVVAASDIVYQQGFSLKVFAQQYHFTSRGWEYVFSDLSSEELLTQYPERTDYLVLSAEAIPESIEPQSTSGPMVLVSVP